MPSRRLQKAAAAIREVVSMAILADLKDPRVRDVTVTGVEVSPDMRQAKVLVSVMGDDTRQRLTLRGLQSAAGFLQAKLSSRIDTRYTPRLEFVLDQGVKKSIEIAKILGRVLPPDEADGVEDSEAADGELGDELDDEVDDELDDELDDEESAATDTAGNFDDDEDDAAADDR